MRQDREFQKRDTADDFENETKAPICNNTGRQFRSDTKKNINETEIPQHKTTSFNFCGLVLIYKKERFIEIFGVGFFKNLVAAEIEINCMYVGVSQFLLPKDLKILFYSDEIFVAIIIILSQCQKFCGVFPCIPNFFLVFLQLI